MLYLAQEPVCTGRVVSAVSLDLRVLGRVSCMQDLLGGLGRSHACSHDAGMRVALTCAGQLVPARSHVWVLCCWLSGLCTSSCALFAC